MPILLEDLAEETSAGNRRLADRLDAEARSLDELKREMAEREDFRQSAIESARQATEGALSRVPQVEGGWRMVVAALCKNPTGDDAERLLFTYLDVFESIQRVLRTARALWALPRQMGAPPERLDELNRAEERFQTLAEEARGALEHRTSGWQPADPDRLAHGLRLAREGKTVTADEARARFP